MRQNNLRNKRWFGFILLFMLFGLFGVYYQHDISFVAGQNSGYPIFLPFLINSDPIAAYLAQIDQERVAEVTLSLVEDYPPRHKEFFQIFKNEQCELGTESWPNHNLIRASKYIASIYQELNFPFYKEWVDDPAWQNSFNVVAQKIGNVYPDVFIELGAHIDTRDKTPGASDNAAGVAAVVEIARVLQDYPNRYSWRFISFVGEEYQFVGSRFHIRQVIEQEEQIKAGLIMDGIGWSEIAPRNMNCLWDNRDPVNREISYLFRDVRDRYVLDIAWRLCQLEAGMWSDNGAYWEMGFPAVASIGGLPYTDPNLHKCGDNMRHVDMQNATLTAMENLGVLLTLDMQEYQPIALGEPTALDIIAEDALSH